MRKAARIRWLERDVFVHTYGGTLAEIFGEGSNPPLKHADWEKILLPYGLHLLKEHFRALSSAAVVVGDEEFVVTDIDSIARHKETAVLEWDYKALEDVRCNSWLGHLNTALFGQSGLWGAVADVDDMLMVVGGCLQFMEAFFDAAGGRAQIRERFEEFATSEWFSDDEVKQRFFGLTNWK